MNTFETVFSTFLTKCAELHTLLLSVAFALFVAGIIVTVHQRFLHRVALHLSIRLMVLTVLLVYLPVWGNKNDPAGDKATRQLLDSLKQRLGELPPHSPGEIKPNVHSHCT